jgi:hypothetical protein
VIRSVCGEIVMAITKCLIWVPPVNRLTAAARALSQCARIGDGWSALAWMEKIMSYKINLNQTTKNRQERQLDGSALTESELHNVVGGDYAQTMMVWFGLLGQMGIPTGRPSGGWS